MLQLSSLFGPGAVLARGKELRVFGEAQGEQVIATLTAADGSVLGEGSAAVREGRFLLRLPPQQAQTGCTLTVRCGEETCVSADVAIGEVYLAAGQSNMELELQNADEGPELIQAHEDPLLRYFNVPKRSVRDEEAVQAERQAHWEAIRPGMGRDMSAVAYFFARKLREHLNVPVGVIDCYWGGTSITCWMDEEALRRTAEGQRYLADYARQCGDKTLATWQAEEAAFQAELAAWNEQVATLKRENPDIQWPDINAQAGPCPWHPPVGPGSPYRPAGLVETMTKRVVPAALTGVLYYQGEEDTWRTTHYDVLLKGLIDRLRELFMDAQLPFLNVQLPMWLAAGATDQLDWPALRHAQELVWRQVRRTGLAVLIDCGEWDNIHPTDKRTPGERLYAQALRVVYGEAGEESPRAVRKYACGHQLCVELNAPVTLRPGEGPLLLEVAGEDGEYHEAELTLDGTRLLLSSTAVERPVFARYAYVGWGRVRLFGENGLPLAPFVMEE